MSLTLSLSVDTAEFVRDLPAEEHRELLDQLLLQGATLDVVESIGASLCEGEVELVLVHLAKLWPGKAQIRFTAAVPEVAEEPTDED